MVMVPVRRQPFPFARPRRKIIVCITLWLSIAATAGCDSASSGPPIARGGDLRTEQLKTNLSSDDIRDIAQPISSTPGLSVERNAAQAGGIGNEGYEVQMGSARGLNSKRLFDVRAGSDDERFERLEAAVQALQDNFDHVNPSINRLMAIEEEIQTLVDQLQILVGPSASAPLPSPSSASVPLSPVATEALQDQTEFPPVEDAPSDTPPVLLSPAALQAQTVPHQAGLSTPSAPVPAMVPAPAAPLPTSSTVPAQVPVTAGVSVPVSGGASLVALRVGDHDKTTRIVLETTKELSYRADVDAEQMLIVSFAGGESALAAAPEPKSSLVNTVDITPQTGGGFVVAMTLSRMTKIVKQGVLKPDSQNPNYRIYIDLAR